MFTVTFVNLLILLGLIPVGMVCSWLCLRGLDKLNGINFCEDVLPSIRHSDTVGVYYGLRFFGVCYLIAHLASRFV